MSRIIKPQGPTVATVTIKVDAKGSVISEFKRHDVVGASLHPLAAMQMVCACMTQLLTAMMQPIKKESVDAQDTQNDSPTE